MVIYQSDKSKTSKYVLLWQATSNDVDLKPEMYKVLAVRRCNYDC